MHNAPGMNRFALLLAFALAAAPLFAQNEPPFEDIFLLRNVSGTTANPGTRVPHVVTGDFQWQFFHSFDAHLTYVSESGPVEQRNETFSTNWLTAGVQRHLGDRALLLLRGRISLEPYTVQEEGYPQILQFVSPEGGEVMLDHMRPQDLFGEAAAHFAYRTSAASFVHLYAAAVGDPALGTAPSALRASGVDFAEAPFAYDIQETFHTKTRVVTLGFTTRVLSIEGSVFHDAITTGDHTEVDDGAIDSRSVRVTLTPTRNFSAQVSRGELGEDDVTQRTVTSGSVSYATDTVAATALWTQREEATRPSLTSFGFEVALRAARNTFMARVESMDRPRDLFLDRNPFVPAVERATHFTIGYLFDFINGPRYKAGAGVNIDYRTNTHELEESEFYGHKPQGIYAFVRFRTR